MESNLFPEFKLGESTPWKAVHRGIEYPGEIVITDSWSPRWGEELEKGLHFRIVLFTKPEDVPLESVHDERIAFCVPGRLPREMEGVAREYLAFKDQRESYRTRGDKEAREAHHSLLRREKELKSKLLREQAGLYGTGRILTKSEFTLDPKEVFTLLENERRFSLIASALLGGACSILPIRSAAFPRALASRDVGKVFLGFFAPKSDLEVGNALKDFAVGLGLAKESNPQKFDPENCTIFETLRDRLKEENGILSMERIHRELRGFYGLTNALLNLYLLCFVYHHNPPVELRLKPKHGLLLRLGQKPPQNRLTWDLVPQVLWTTGMEDEFECLCFRTEPLWNQALPYSCLLLDGLKETTAAVEIERQEDALTEKLRELRDTVKGIQENLRLLGTGLGTLVEGETRDALERISRIAQAKNHLELYNAAQREYAIPGALAEDLALCRRLSSLKEVASEVLAVKSYLENAELGENESELALDRVSIQEQVDLKNLLANPHVWPSVKALFDWFRSRYRAVYLAHHASYHRELNTMRLSLENASREVEALGRLNSLAELGPPLGGKLSDEYERLLTKIKPCPEEDSEKLPLEREPICPSCRLSLAAEPPAREVERFHSRLRRALEEQYSRLSTEAVRQVLAQSRDSRTDQFIKVIQTSDLSSLANVLNDELVDFLRYLLAEACTESFPLLRRLKERFPAIEENQIEEAVAELRVLLKEAFAEAKRRNPGKRIRIEPE